MVYKLKPKLKLPSPFYDINDAIVFFSLASFFILALRELPFSTHCWYRGTHCTESTKPPNFLAFSKICWTNPQCVASKFTLYQRPWLFTIPQCRAWPAAVVRSKGLWVICIWRLHMGFVQVVKTEKKLIFCDCAKPFIRRWVIEWKIEKPEEALLNIKGLK